MTVDLPFEAAAQSGKVTDFVGDNRLRYRSRKMRIDDSIPKAELADRPNNITTELYRFSFLEPKLTRQGALYKV
jgi:hypothetical protein